MKRLIRNITFFLAPVLIVLLWPVNERLKFQCLQNDCADNALWIYDRIYSSGEPIDIAFFGSSHTRNGINDGLIEDSLTEKDMHVVNFGYCRLGNNLIYTLMKDLTEKKNVKRIILEVREDENLFSHPIFPYIARTHEVLSDYPAFNKHYFLNVFNHFSYKLEILQIMLLNKEEKLPLRSDNHGFATTADTADSLILLEAKQKRAHQKKLQPPLIRNFQLEYPRICLEKISVLCLQKNIQLEFLYIPAYGSTYKRPLEYATYMKYGKVLIPPAELLTNPDNWGDEGHLNQTGAMKLSQWIASSL